MGFPQAAPSSPCWWLLLPKLYRPPNAKPVDVASALLAAADLAATAALAVLNRAYAAPCVEEGGGMGIIVTGLE